MVLIGIDKKIIEFGIQTPEPVKAPEPVKTPEPVKGV